MVRRAAAKTLTAGDILAADDIKIEAVPVPAWGGVVHVKTWTAAERGAFDAMIIAQGEDHDADAVRLKIIELSLCDADGRPLFDADGVRGLAAKSAAALNLVFQAADRVNAITSVARDDLAGN